MTSAYYQYTPLTSENAFRLFRVTKCPLTDDDTPSLVEIELFEASFDAPPPFEAVSYAWGGREKDCILACGDSLLPVSATVVDFLIALRRQHILHPRDLSEAKPLWIDAICINQDSVGERNVQVPRMRTIYHEADQVWVWLGRGTVETDIAFDYLVEKHDSGASQYSYTERDLSTDSAYKNEVVRKRGFYDPVDTDFIVDIINLPWFGRTWTVQELLLCNSAMILCGSKAMPWLAFASMLNTIQESACNTLYFLHPSPVSNPVTFYDDISCYHNFGSIFIRSGGISGILTRARRQEATEPKDKVYGLYGIIEHAKLPKVDYDYTVQRIYTDTTVAALRYDPTVDVLHQTCLQPIISHLPSWVPDWSNAAFIQPFPRVRTLCSNQFIQVRGRRLLIDGSIFDTIFEVADSTSTCSDNFKRGWSARKYRDSPEERHGAVKCLIHTLQAWVELGLRDTAHEISRESLCTFSSLILGIVPERFTLSPCDFQDILNILVSIVLADPRQLEQLHQNVQSHESYLGVVKDYRELFGLSGDTNEWSYELIKHLVLRLHSTEISILQHDISLFTYQRTLFTTRNGYMGIGPRWMKPGDKVVAFSGYNVPFILREAHEYYKLLGPAYIDRMMKWEHRDGKKAGIITLV